MNESVTKRPTNGWTDGLTNRSINRLINAQSHETRLRKIVTLVTRVTIGGVLSRASKRGKEMITFQRLPSQRRQENQVTIFHCMVDDDDEDDDDSDDDDGITRILSHSVGQQVTQICNIQFGNH